MTLPRIRLLSALRAHFRAAVAAAVVAGDIPKAFKVRHWRFRNPSTKEWPCVSLRYAGDDPQGTTRPTDGDRLSTSEEVFELGITLQADAALPAEKDEENGDDEGPDDDPTGLRVPSEMLELLLNSLFTPGEQPVTLGGMAYDIRYDGSADDDDDSKPDNVRLSERIVIEYRVRKEAPTHLLLGE
jgi:hypothetical protein